MSKESTDCQTKERKGKITVKFKKKKYLYKINVIYYLV